MTRLTRMAMGSLVAASLAAAGCGSSGSPRTTGGGGGAAPATGGSSSQPGALSAEAQSAATGDIPDNQVFLTFRNAAAGYEIKYPEGWAQHGAGDRVTFQDKNNVMRIVEGQGAPPTAASVRANLQRLRASSASLSVGSAQGITLPAGRAIKVTYRTRSGPNPVTGKRVTLVVDRYVLAHSGRRAVVDLGTPVGVDNVDAYRLIIHSLRWIR